MLFSIKKHCLYIKPYLPKLHLLVIILFATFIAGAQNINTPNKMGPLGTQVNTYTGNLFISRNDIYIPGRGFDFSIAFNYNSYNFDRNGGFGNGWIFGYSIKYKIDSANNITIMWGDGKEDKYTVLPGNNYKSPKGYFNVLTQYQANKFLLTEVEGTQFYFDNGNNKRITKMTEPNGNMVTFNYSDTLLTSVVNSSGQTIAFTYDSYGRLKTIVDAIAAPTRTFTNTYDGNNNLTQVTDPSGSTYKYSYLVNGPMKTITDKNNNTADIIYFSDLSVSELIGCNKRVSFSYDTVSNITIVTDYLSAGNSQVTKYSYKKFEDKVWLTSLNGNCCGYNLSFEYDANGNKIKETDANGNAYYYTYDTRGNVLSMKDPLNQLSIYTYTPNFNNIASVTDPKGNISTMNYDASGNLVQLTEPGNKVSSATYNVNGDILSSTDPKGNIFTYGFDVNGNLSSAIGPHGSNIIFANDAHGNVLSFTDARGNVNSMQYDILDRLKKITDPLNNAVQFNYDAQGNPILVTNKNNELTGLNYDASNRFVQSTDQIGQHTQMNYDGMNNLLGFKNELGNAINITYDTRNRLSSITDAQSNTSNNSYDANGNVTNVTLANGQRLSYTYDNINRVTGISDINGTIATLAYDKNDNVTTYTNGLGAVTTASYDNLDRVSQLTDPLGYTSLFSYDKNNMVTAVTDRNGFTKNYTYDSLNRIKTITDNNGFTISRSYDAIGNLTQIKDQKNNTTNYTYDNLDRLKTITYPDGKFIQNNYNNKSNITSCILTDGTIITYQYDSLSRVVGKTLPDGQVFVYGYDALGRVISASNNAGSVSITYDVLNRIISETYDGRTTRYSYDIAGRTQTTTYPDSTVITKTFDTRNRLTSIGKNNTIIVNYQYNNSNQLTIKNFSNGVNSNIQYDFANRLSSISTAAGSIQNTSFTYDKERNKTAIYRQNNPSLSEQYIYDNGYRLTNFKRGIPGGVPNNQNQYSYDAVGNRLAANLNGINTNYISNNLNQLANSTNGSQNINFIYDNNGNLIFDGSFYKFYDAEKRLVKDSSSVSNIFTYKYDAFGRRVQKNINGTTYKYTYSGIVQIEERNGATNSLLARTIFANYLTPVLLEKNNSSFFYHQNELNSVEAITNSSGNLLERYQYDVFGKPTIYDGSNNVISSSIAGNRFAYTGQEYDSVDSSYHFYFRNYSPVTGTFNQRDQIGYADQMGMYQYTGNNPGSYLDPLGLDPCPPQETETLDQKAEFWGSQISNIGSWLQIHQSSITEDIWGVTRILKKGRYKRSIPVLLKLGSGGNILTRVGEVVNSPLVTKFMLPVNVINTAIPAYKLATGADQMSGSDILDNSLSVASGGSTTIVGAVSLASPGALTATGLASAPVLTATVATAGGLAIAGLVDLGFRGVTGVMGYAGLKEGGSESIIGFSGSHDLPVFTWGVRSYYETQATSSDIGVRLNQKRQGKLAKWDRVQKEMEERHMRYKLQHTYAMYGGGPCPPNDNDGGTQINKPKSPGLTGQAEGISSKDPNVIIGPDGQPFKNWVSVHDRMPYTILYENAKTASAPAKFVRITSPVQPKQDAGTFQLGEFGFNNQTFNVAPGTASLYQRLDCQDSLGLYVDVTAGYDQISNQAFWEFQSIDPLTLLPPTNPLKGFLLLQDSVHANYGHAFVNFSMKPVASALTLDTIGATALIVFDSNDTIPTNIAKNTIDAFPPTSHMVALPSTSNSPVHLVWSGTDDTGGSGVKSYTLYVSTDNVNFSIIRAGITRNDTTVALASGQTYCFFVLATDSVGNMETLRPGETRCTFTSGVLPVTLLYFNGSTQGKTNTLDWATATEINTREFILERSLDGTSFTGITTIAAAGNSSSNKYYQYKDLNIDQLNSPVMFYRLKLIDMDGHITYSNIVRLTYNQKSYVKSLVYPNPTDGRITLVVGENSLIGTNALLIDLNGKLLETIRIKANSQSISFDKYVNGVYFIRLNNNEVIRVVKQ